MDYIKLPRSLIYKERKSLKDFGVLTKGTLNHYLFMRMARMTLLRTGDSEQIALQCLNNAYYICTLILLDEFPYLKMDKYEEKLLEEIIPFPNDVYQASMALVCVLLAAYDDKYKQKDDILIENIYHWTSSNKWTGSLSHNSFVNIIKECRPDGFSLSLVDFAPRDIIEVIETFGVRDLQVYAEYICERLALIENPRQRMHGADMAIAKIKDYQRELCKEYEYDPKKDCFKYANNIPLKRDLDLENTIRDNYRQCKEAIDYYTNHYPKEDNIHHEQQTDSELSISSNSVLVTENEQLRKQLEQRISEIQEMGKENVQLKEKLAELLEPVEELSAEQKVRMAFALQLFKAAGLTDEMLEKHGNKAKVATLMSLLTGISSLKNKRGNEAQTCQTFLTDKKYYPRKQNMDTLINLNNLCAELGIDAVLNLESQSNNKK